MTSALTPPPYSFFAYGLFISHAWDYAEDYDGVVRLLDSDLRLPWKNLSIPIERPIEMSTLLPKSNRRIIRELEERISQSDALLVLAGMYVHHSAWIQSEIEIAQDYKKPIIGVKPRGQERLPFALQSLACELVGWTTPSIVQAVRSRVRPSHRVFSKQTVPSTAAANVPNSWTNLQPPPSTSVSPLAKQINPRVSSPAGLNSQLSNLALLAGLKRAMDEKK